MVITFSEIYFDIVMKVRMSLVWDDHMLDNRTGAVTAKETFSKVLKNISQQVMTTREQRSLFTIMEHVHLIMMNFY